MKKNTKKLYKVLVNGESCHGGSLKWSLPKKKEGKWVPGKWHEVDGSIKVCSTGLHVTTERFKWYKWGCTAYEVEADMTNASWEDDKVAVRKCRLIKEVKHPKWWTDAEGWIATLKDIAWLKPDGKPKKEWKLFPTRDAAGDTRVYVYAIVAEWNFESKHQTHIKKRMEVWQKGYGLLCDVNGVLYVYEKI